LIVRVLWFGSITSIVLALAACSRGSEGAASNAASSAAPPVTTRRVACEMVTAAEMSAIVGTTVGAEREEGNGTTTCRYKPADRSTPYVELKVEWGGGTAAMMAAGFLSKHEPGIADPLAGLGDGASVMGPALWVRVGEDLLNLTLSGVEDDVSVAKRIVTTMRPRMGPSSQPKVAEAGGRDAAGAIPKQAQELIGSLLGRLGQPEPAAPPRHEVAPTAPRVPEPTFRSAAGLPRRKIPLVKGLTMVLARHEPRRGDWEGIGTIDDLSPREVSMTYRADPPDIGPLVIARVVRRADLKESHRLYGRFTPGDPVEFPGSTALSFSTAVLNEIKTRGETMFERHSDGERGMLRRVESEPVAFPVLVNNEAVEVPAIHVRDSLGGGTHDYYILDDPDNALMLRASDGGSGNSSQMVRIAFPVESEPAAIEARLKKEGRVDVYGIYFDFAMSTLRPESDRVLDEIATVLNNNPAWKLKVDGHTDNIGGDDYNVDLSRRRSAAVKAALVERYRIASDRLTTDGLGAARPKASNDTLSGRAQNRRVELVRQ
jgi:outer membrane protein OmpA-like peptidoglycan-associated protein